MKIYIAGALSSKEKTQRDPTKVVIDYIQNVHKMCLAASEVRKRGHYPFVPGIDLLLGLVIGNWKEEDYRETGMEFMKVCDALLVISDSWGVQEEIKEAKKRGLKIFYSIEEL